MIIITIKDVAKAANVSSATVSRVFNCPETVSISTKEKVLGEAKKLGFYPNLLGRHLRCRETKIILVMLSSIANTFCSNVIRHIEKEANKNGYNIMICATNGSPDKDELYLNYVKNRFADGVIILSSTLSSKQMDEISQNYPVVQCNEYVESKSAPYVSIDNFSAAYEAVDYLIKEGRKNIAYFGVNNELISSKLRLEGYKKALFDNNINFDENLIIWGNYSYRNGILVTNNFLKKNIKIDALFAISDRMAAGAITSLKQHNFKVPDDVAVIGFDDTDISYINEPTISTVAQPQVELGRTAFIQLLKVINGENAENIILKHKIKLKNSTNKGELL